MPVSSILLCPFRVVLVYACKVSHFFDWFVLVCLRRFAAFRVLNPHQLDFVLAFNVISVCSLPLISRISVSSYVVRCYALLRLISLNALRASFRSMRSEYEHSRRSVMALALDDFCPLLLL